MENSEKQEPTYRKLYAGRWRTAMHAGRLEEAMVWAIKGYVVATDHGDPVEAMTCLGRLDDCVQKRLAALAPTQARPERPFCCSFCGEERAKNDLVAGPGVIICRICAARVTDAFPK